MIITEKDIFDFVFNPEELTAEKLSYINKNENKFSEQIDLCNETNKVLLASKKQGMVFKLDKILTPTSKETTFVKLAAESPQLAKKSSVFTFIDNEEKFIIKIISVNESSDAYVFSKENSVLKNFQLKIYPSEILLECKNNSAPIKFITPNCIDKVELIMQ